MKCQLTAELISIDFKDSSDGISQKNDLQPSEVVTKGGVRRVDPNGKRPPILNDHDLWVHKIPTSDALDFDDCLDHSLRYLAAYATSITEIS